MTSIAQITSIHKLVSDETRLRLLLLLHNEDLCVCELSGILDAPQPKISKILSKLRDLNLVIDDRKERFVYYHLKDDHPYLESLLNLLSLELENNPRFIEDQKRCLNKATYSTQCVLSSDGDPKE
jgi:ArsR family transcriptional regulator